MSDNKKQHSRLIKNVLKISAGVILIGGSCGLVFGLTARLSYKQKFINITPYLFKDGDVINSNVAADYSLLAPFSYWNCTADDEPTNERNDVYNDSMIDDTDPMDVVNNVTSETLYACGSQILDGSTHVVLDKSFNESSYLGLVNWIHQKDPELGDNFWKVGEDIRLKNSQLKYAESGGYKNGSYFAKYNKPGFDDKPNFLNAYKVEINNMPSKEPDNPQSPKKGSLLLPGYIHEAPLAAFKDEEKKMYDTATYTILDGGIQSERCASVYYRADQSAFLCGIAACQYLQDRYDEIYSKVNNGKLAVGTFGGMSLPTVTSFMGGFEWGIYVYNRYFLPNFEGYDQWDNETKEKRKVDLICIGRSESFYSNSFVASEARPLVQQLLLQGADAIMAVAGPQTIDVVNEIKSQASPAIAIGVDTDQENSDIGQQYRSKSKLNYGDKIIQFSAKKDLAGITSTILQARAKGVRGYYFDEDFNAQFLDYDGTNLANEEKECIQRSFIGNSGYATVGTIYNKGAGISIGAEENTLENHDNDNFVGTGWESLFNALKLIDEQEVSSCTEYNDLIIFLLDKKFVENDVGDHINVFQFLEDNKYFVYE